MKVVSFIDGYAVDVLGDPIIVDGGENRREAEALQPAAPGTRDAKPGWILALGRGSKAVGWVENWSF